MSEMLFTSESVTEGHPDKLCDRISDAVLDAVMREDPGGRVACETVCTTGMILVTGEMSTSCWVDIPATVREAVKDIGYDSPEAGFDGNTCGVMVSLDEQSPDIALGTNDGVGGAGDQGMMFGYACDETPDLMPLPVTMAHRMAYRLAQARKSGAIPDILPDGKTQVTVRYADGKPAGIDAVVVSTQHRPGATPETLRGPLLEHVIQPVLDEAAQWHPGLDTAHCRLFINPTGKFEKGGPAADSGLTGRKIIVDTYGGYAPHGGGAFCVDSETEFLTPDGWRRMPEYRVGEYVAEWDRGVVRFVQPVHYIVTRAQEMYRAVTEAGRLDMVVSGGHSLVMRDKCGRIVKTPARKWFRFLHPKTARTIPASFRLPDGFDGYVYLTDEQVRLQTAFCCMGTLVRTGNGMSARVMARHSKKRRDLLRYAREAGVEVKITGECPIMHFRPPLATSSLAESFRGASRHILEVMLRVIMRWTTRKNKFMLQSREDADFLQFAYTAVTGRMARVVYRGSHWFVLFHRASGYGVKALQSDDYEPPDDRMYCFSVPSGMLLMRRRGSIFVTGNSGKDCTKVDRSGAYMARYIAKNVVAAGLAKECTVQLAYAIGVPEPVSVRVEMEGMKPGVTQQAVERAVVKCFDLTPAGIIRKLDLRQPIYQQFSAYGHFGLTNGIDRTWEHTDMAEELAAAILTES